MALVMSVTLESGITVEQSYVVVSSVGGGKDQAVIEVKYFVSADLKEEGKPHFLLNNHKFIPLVNDESPNFIKQGYEYLKTLPEFVDAIDA